MPIQNRIDVRCGLDVEIVLKADQRTGALTRGIVAEILTNSNFHPHGIKVRLEDGQVGRVQALIQGEDDWQNMAGADTLKHLEPQSKEEYDYYSNL